MRNIPPDLLEKIKKQNQTIYENADPKMSVQVSRAKTTVTDSTYWTVEIIRKKDGIGDLSIAARRFKPHGRPNRLYNIYVDNGVVKTAIREYPDYQENKWQYQFELGEGTAVAIEFDGYWQLYRDMWRLVTEESPYVFWVDDNNDLYVQLWDDEDTRIKLDEDVVKVKAQRGWRNINMPELDQGVIALYIKDDGKVYYRNYCYQKTTEKYAWEVARQVTEFEGTAVNINAFMANDYRTGIIIEDDQGKIHWLITERNWTGMAIAPEFISARLTTARIDFIPIEKISTEPITEYISAELTTARMELIYGAPYNSILSAFNVSVVIDGETDWGYDIEIVTEYPLIDVDYHDFSIKDDLNVGFVVTSVTDLGDNEYVIHVDNFNNAHENINVTFGGTGNTRGPAGQIYDPFSTSFLPINLVPTAVAIPEVEAIWNE